VCLFARGGYSSEPFPVSRANVRRPVSEVKDYCSTNRRVVASLGWFHHRTVPDLQ
jgi:hypothetical protein